MSQPKRSEVRVDIGIAARDSGLSRELIRAWESRYGVVDPDRSGSNRRLYSWRQVEHLRRLRILVDAGHRIGNLAALSFDEVEALSAQIGGAHLDGDEDGHTTIDHALEAIGRLDAVELQRCLDAASVRYSRVELMDDFLVPLMTEVGERCRSGMLRPAHEHMATSSVRGFVQTLGPAYPPAESSPGVVVGTPTGQHHEIASMLVAATARMQGWRVTYLGSNLPAEEIARAVAETRARLLAISITYPPGDQSTATELIRLGRLLDHGVMCAVGGRSATSYANEISRSGMKLLDSLAEFRDLLEVSESRTLEQGNP